MYGRTLSASEVADHYTGGALLGWNDLWTMKNRPKTYRYYAGIHRQMTLDRPFRTAPPITDGLLSPTTR